MLSCCPRLERRLLLRAVLHQHAEDNMVLQPMTLVAAPHIARKRIVPEDLRLNDAMRLPDGVQEGSHSGLAHLAPQVHIRVVHHPVRRGVHLVGIQFVLGKHLCSNVCSRRAVCHHPHPFLGVLLCGLLHGEMVS